jgi:hypothetical protein
MRIARSRLYLIAVSLLLIGSLAACLNDAAEPSIDLSATPNVGTAIALPTPTGQALATATAPEISWLPSIHANGAGELPATATFFRNGPNVWAVMSDLTIQQVTTNRRVRDVATRPGTDSAAVVMLDTQGGREAEVIHLVDLEGNESDPIYGPEITGDPAGNPSVALLRWSPDGERLAIVREDGSIWIATPDGSVTGLAADALDPTTESVQWSPTGNALAVLYRKADDAGFVRVIHLENEEAFELGPLSSFGSFAWLPEPSRFVVGEDRAAGPNPHAGSIFFLSVDGQARNLLLSAGEFGPAVGAGQLSSSPDGTQIAFTIEMPGADGEYSFQSLHVLDLGSGIRRQLDVARGFAVSDLWWLDGRLVWRAVSPPTTSSYSGVEPFVIEAEDPQTGQTLTLFRSDGG